MVLLHPILDTSLLIDQTLIQSITMSLMFLPVTMIEGMPHLLLHYDFTRKENRYFLSPYQMNISAEGPQRTICDRIHSSNFLCALLDIDRPAVLKQLNDGSAEKNPSNESGSSFSSANTDLLMKLIEEKIDFKHRSTFYPIGGMAHRAGKKSLMNRVDAQDYRRLF